MKLCPACSRHVKRDQATCPFCQVTLAPTSSTLAALSLAAGLVVAGCAGDDGKDTETTGESSTSTTSSTSSTTSTTTSTTTTATTAESTSSTTEMSVSAYGGPPADTITDGRSLPPPPDKDAPPSPEGAGEPR